MKVAEIRDQAKQMGISQAGKLRKGDLVRAIQQQENNPACFGSDGRFECQELVCCWRGDCLTANPG